MKELTVRQEEILQFIKNSTSDNGYPPTLREIGAHTGIRSTNGVNDHLRALERKGYLTRTSTKSRGLKPVGLPDPPAALSYKAAVTVLATKVTPDTLMSWINGACEALAAVYGKAPEKVVMDLAKDSPGP